MKKKEKPTNETESIDIVLYIEIGTVNSRVSLFERSESRYRYIGSVSSRTIYSEAGEVTYESVVNALRKLENVLDRHFLNDNNRIVTPRKFGMIGADQIILSWSGGETPRIALLGLTDRGSMHAMEKLLDGNGLHADVRVCAMDGNSLTDNIDQLLAADPDIVLLSGGTESGAERAVYRLGEILQLVCKSIPENSRPRILYLGNSAARAQFEKVFARMDNVSFADNVLDPPETPENPPTLAFQKELTEFAREHNQALAILSKEIDCSPISADFAYGRCVRLLSRMNREDRKVLGIEVGASRTLTAFGHHLHLEMSTLNVGVGSTLERLLTFADTKEIMPRISFLLKESELRDYIMNKSVHPELIPANNYSAEIEQILAGCLIRQSVEENPAKHALEDGSIGMILLGGAVLRNVEDPGDALRIGMDNLHIPGQTDYYLDMNGIASAIGAFAARNRELAAQLTTPSMFLNLGKVVTPLCKIKEGKKAFSVSLRDNAGNVKKYEINVGGIKRIPLEYGRYYELDWYDVSNGIKIPGVNTLTPIGFKSGCFGLVFDMRGDTLTMPKERTAQIHLLERWKKELGPWKIGE